MAALSGIRPRRLPARGNEIRPLGFCFGYRARQPPSVRETFASTTRPSNRAPGVATISLCRCCLTLVSPALRGCAKDQSHLIRDLCNDDLTPTQYRSALEICHIMRRSALRELRENVPDA